MVKKNKTLEVVQETFVKKRHWGSTTDMPSGLSMGDVRLVKWSIQTGSSAVVFSNL